MANITEYKLDNGLVVALQNTQTQIISTKLRINQGASHEKRGEEGMTHFLEHCLVTGGSQKYNPIQADEIRSSFGYSNAFTNLGRTFFLGEMLKEDLEVWLDYTSDHIFNPRFDLERVNGERERVLREIFDNKSSSEYESINKFKDNFYRDHPKKISPLGKEEVVKNATLEKITKIHSKGFSPNNMELLITGELPKNINKLIEKYFGKFPKGRNTRKEFPELKLLKGIKTIHCSAPDLINTNNPKESSAYLCLAYVGPLEKNIESYSIIAMNQILGIGTNSFLFQNMGLKKGLAYNAGTSYNGDYNAGESYVYANVSASRIDEAVNAMFEEIEKMKTQKMEDKRVDGVKKMVIYHLTKTLASIEGHMEVIEAKLDYGLTPKKIIKIWDEVSPETIQQVANKYLPTQNKGDYILYIRDPLKQ